MPDYAARPGKAAGPKAQTATEEEKPQNDRPATPPDHSVRTLVSHLVKNRNPAPAKYYGERSGLATLALTDPP